MLQSCVYYISGCWDLCKQTDLVDGIIFGVGTSKDGCKTRLKTAVRVFVNGFTRIKFNSTLLD